MRLAGGQANDTNISARAVVCSGPDCRARRRCGFPASRPDGAASDPLAVVTFTDLRVTSNDLEGGNERNVFSVEGAFVFHPKFKVNYDANYWRTDVAGSTESGWADLRIKPIYFPRARRWPGLIYRTAVGLDLRIDTGNVDKVSVTVPIS